MKKNYIKKNIIGFIVGVILCTGTFVYAAVTFPSNEVTYDNTESGLTSNDVKGAIDELYETCTALPPGEQIIEDNNLEKDPYECRYFFTGANPNNYITFNNETAGWRIISVECDGRLKIVKNNNIGSMAWDTSGSNDWSRPASLNAYLNSTYYNGLNSTARSQIVTSDFSIGSVVYNDTDLGNSISNENSKLWSGLIGLPIISEYIRSNSDQDNCGTVRQLWNAYTTKCGTTTWMNNNSSWWTMTASSPYNNISFYVQIPGYLYNLYGVDRNNILVIRPTLYLSSEVKLTGSGTQSDPYVVS